MGKQLGSTGRFTVIVLVISILFVSSICFGTDRLVPGVYSTIQAGIDAAGVGDTVIVSVGTYYENIVFNGTDLILTSTNPDDWGVVGATVIDGGGIGRVVEFLGSETSGCELSGFTITGGYADKGGGIHGNLSTATISRCIVENNDVTVNGGGLIQCDGTVTNCIVRGNTAAVNGGGLNNCSGAIINCLVYGNIADYGGGINNCDGNILNCTVADNAATTNGGGLRDCDGTVTNCVVWGNSSDELYLNTAVFTYNCVGGWSGGGAGNISDDPLFAGAASGDYHLLAGSLCIDGGTNSPAGGLPGSDLEGQVRPVDGDNDGTATADMGVYESLFTTIVDPIISLSISSLQFSAFEGDPNPADQSFTIRNSGLGTLNWTISESCSWLSVSPSTGDSMGEADTVTVSVDTTGLLVGDHSCDLTISGAGATNSPQTVTVDLRIGNVFFVPSAYSTIQAGINAANNGDTVIVADGTYTGDGNRDIDLLGKAITVKSANGPESCIIDCQGSESEHHNGFNLNYNGEPVPEGESSVIEGFRIINGYTNGGAGVLCMDYNLVIKNCEFINGTAIYWGGGVETNSSTEIIDCLFEGNSAMEGGAITTRGYWGNNPTAVIDGCLIRDNFGEISGGGINSDVITSPIITNCTITGNSSGSYGGGGIAIWQSNPTISNCLITGNLTTGRGSGIRQSYLFEDGSKISNCTISGNKGEGNDTSGVECFAEMVLTNCILRDNIDLTPGDYVESSDRDMTFNYCDLPEPYEGNNISVDPLFFAPGHWEGDIWAAGDYHLTAGSLCIDAGSDTAANLGFDDTTTRTDQAVDADIVDMGYHYNPTTNPKIMVSDVLLTFMAFEGGGNPGDQMFAVFNVGVETLAWTISESCSWFSVSPSSGSSTIEPSVVTVSVDISGLTLGDYTCGLTISDPNAVNNPQRVTVDLHVGSGFYVPSVYPTIQSGIDAAGVGDTVVVSAGVYYENVVFNGIDITVTSTNPDDWGVVAATVIDGGGVGRVVTFSGTETSGCVLSGFTIANGSADLGGGINGSGGSATISRCIVENNNSTFRGGGLRLCNGTITHCIIRGNAAVDNGGGLNACYGDIINCLIYDNIAGLGGGGIQNGSGNIVNCTVAYNSAGGTGGGLNICNADITNCIVWGNSAGTGDQLYNSVDPTQSCVEGGSGGAGNISDDPLFVAGPLGGYYLSQVNAGQGANSLCVDAGSDTAVSLGLDSFTTRNDKVGDSGVVDMGYHYPITVNHGDIDGSGQCDVVDFGILSSQFGGAPGVPSADIWPIGVGDGVVGIDDLWLFLQGWMW